MATSKLFTYIFILSIAFLIRLSLVAGHPMHMDAFNQTHAHDCSIHINNTSCNCTTSLGDTGPTLNTTGFIGQEQNVTLIADPFNPFVKRDGNGGNSTSDRVYSSGSSSIKDSITWKVMLAVLVSVTLVVVLAA